MATPYNIFGAVGLSGTSLATLDKISADVIKHNDFAIVSNENLIYFYKLDSYSGEAANEPFIIKPNDITDSSIAEIASKRWILISQKYYNSDITLPLNNILTTSKIKAISDNVITITSATNKVITIHTDGKVSFPSTISINDPVSDSDATTKLYVDNEISELKTYSDEQTDELKTYSDEQNDTLKTYSNAQLTGHENNINVHFTIYSENITDWYVEGSLYFNDIIHNKNRDVIFSEFYFDNKKIQPEKVEKIDNNTLRVWMPNNLDLKVIII